MNRHEKSMKKATIIFALATTALAQAQVDPGRVVAKVNGTEIHGREYYSRMEIQPGLGAVGPGGKFIQFYPGYITMRLLIEEHLIIQLAQSQGVAPSATQFEAEFKNRMDTRKEQFQAWLNLGFSEADMKHEVMVDMCQFAILTRGITITDFEVERYYKDNVDKFTLPKRYQLRMIRVKDEEEARKVVDAALAGGTKFQDAAAQHSVDVTKLNGGLLGIVAEGEVTPAVRTALSKIKKGQATGWVTDANESAKFFIEDIKGIEVLPLDDNVKRNVREMLMRERGQARNNVPLMMQEFRQKAKLEFENFPFSDDLKRFFELGG